jgi:long-chain acyl-CoA synthetase
MDVTHLYGLTETFGPAVICEWRAEWSGLPMGEQARLKARQGVGNLVSQELRVIDARGHDVPHDGATLGEIALRGNNVMLGYYRDELATRKAMPDGWFRTGDLGRIDDDGFLTITGRSKEIIVTAGGKNVAPAALEDVVRSHPLVAQCMVVGDQRNYVAALVTLDEESVPGWLSENKRAVQPLAELTDDPGVRAAVQTAVDAANATVSSAEQIRRFRILDAAWTEDTGHLTPTMKLKRTKVLADFADEVEALYASRH